MDITTNPKAQEVIAKLLSFGHSSDKVKEMVDLAVEQVLDDMIGEFAMNAEETLVTEMTDKLTAAQTDAEKQVLIEQIAVKLYGDTSDQVIQDKIVKFLEDIVTMTENAKDLAAKYQAGDPDAVAKVQAAMQTPEAKEIEEELKKAE